MIRYPINLGENLIWKITKTKTEHPIDKQTSNNDKSYYFLNACQY